MENVKNTTWKVRLRYGPYIFFGKLTTSRIDAYFLAKQIFHKKSVPVWESVPLWGHVLYHKWIYKRYRVKYFTIYVYGTRCNMIENNNYGRTWQFIFFSTTFSNIYNLDSWSKPPWTDDGKSLEESKH